MILRLENPFLHASVREVIWWKLTISRAISGTAKVISSKVDVLVELTPLVSIDQLVDSVKILISAVHASRSMVLLKSHLQRLIRNAEKAILSFITWLRTNSRRILWFAPTVKFLIPLTLDGGNAKPVYFKKLVLILAAIRTTAWFVSPLTIPTTFSNLLLNARRFEKSVYFHFIFI